MDHRIETIWKQGFLRDDALVAPRINDLYALKSRHIADRIQRMYRTNLLAIIVGSALYLAWSLVIGHPYAGLLVSLALSGLAWWGRRRLGRVSGLDQGASSYEYLIAFRRWWEETLDVNARICRLLYPTIVLAAGAGIYQAPYEQLLAGDGASLTLVGVVVLAVTMSAFAGPISRFDVNLVYGSVFAKVDELIADMEELRNGNASA